MQTIEIFKKISKIPHCSNDTQKLKEYIKEFCINEGCKVDIDMAENILAKKGEAKICLQSHYDMVCVGKAPEIEIVEDKGCLKAKESTLGADNGIGVALMLNVAKNYDNVELLFTNDEEIGMIGAKNLQLKISSKNILNLDTEEEGKVYIGCAGGVDVVIGKKIDTLKLEEDCVYEITTDNFPGGHSGVDIDKGIPNAIKVLANYLSKFYPKIISFKGGEALNSIPKSAKAIIAIDKSESPPLDKNVKIKKIDNNSFTTYIKESINIIDLINGFADGIRGYDATFCIPSKSVNLSKIKIVDDMLNIELFPRANSNVELEEIKSEINSYFKQCGCEVKFYHQFGAWKPNINDFSKEVCNALKEVFGRCEYAAIHAGLECGILLDKLGDDKQVVSVGPNIYNPHSTSERCEIESIKKLEKVIKKLVR